MEQQLQSGTVSMGAVFFNVAPFFKIYSEYCRNYEVANNTLIEALKKQNFQNFLREALSHSAVNQPTLQSYLIMPGKPLLFFPLFIFFPLLFVSPFLTLFSSSNLLSLFFAVQKLPKTLLLLQDLQKKTPKGHADYENVNKSVQMIKSVTEHVNEVIRQAEKSYKIWQNSPAVSQLMDAHRNPIKKEVLSVQLLSSPSSPRTLEVVLFNDMVVLISGSDIVDKFRLETVWLSVTKNESFTLLRFLKTIFSFLFFSLF
jgi:hypothetical protein